MTVELVVLGVILIVMGIVQTWLRHGPGGRALRAEDAEVAARRAQAIAAARAAEIDGDEDADDDAGAEDDGGAGGAPGAAPNGRRQADRDCRPVLRSGKVWTAWTAILGGVGIALGIVLVVLGALGY